VNKFSPFFDLIASLLKVILINETFQIIRSTTAISQPYYIALSKNHIYVTAGKEFTISGLTNNEKKFFFLSNQLIVYIRFLSDRQKQTVH
jgi:hypothetical protein